MTYPLHATCPQCHAPENIKRACGACGYLYPPASLLMTLLRFAVTLPVGIALVLMIFLLATVMLKYLVFPALDFIVKL